MKEEYGNIICGALIVTATLLIALSILQVSTDNQAVSDIGTIIETHDRLSADIGTKPIEDTAQRTKLNQEIQDYNLTLSQLKTKYTAEPGPLAKLPADKIDKFNQMTAIAYLR